MRTQLKPGDEIVITKISPNGDGISAFEEVEATMRSLPEIGQLFCTKEMRTSSVRDIRYLPKTGVTVLVTSNSAYLIARR